MRQIGWCGRWMFSTFASDELRMSQIRDDGGVYVVRIRFLH